MLLSYIVNHNEMTISKKKIVKFIPIVIAGFAAAFGAFWGISVLACKILYAQYAPSAMPYIPIIIAAILFETCAAILNIALLRFAKTVIQTIISATKVVIYLLSVFVLTIVAKTGLWGFCFAILIADVSSPIAVIAFLSRNIAFTE